MAQHDNRADVATSSANPSFVPVEIATMGRKSIETFSTAQKEMLAALEQVNRDWWGHLTEEASLTSDFAQRVTKAKSIPDVAAAYQEMMTQRMTLLSKQGQKLLEDTQSFMNACARTMGNGKNA